MRLNADFIHGITRNEPLLPEPRCVPAAGARRFASPGHRRLNAQASGKRLEHRHRTQCTKWRKVAVDRDGGSASLLRPSMRIGARPCIHEPGEWGHRRAPGPAGAGSRRRVQPKEEKLESRARLKSTWCQESRSVPFRHRSRATSRHSPRQSGRRRMPGIKPSRRSPSTAELRLPRRF